MKELKVVNDNVLVEPIEPDETTQSGLIVSTTSNSGFKFGKVLDCGSRWESFSSDGITRNVDVTRLKPSDVIVYKTHQELIHQMKTYHVVKQKDVVAIEIFV